jgi:hypothetical protein
MMLLLELLELLELWLSAAKKPCRVGFAMEVALHPWKTAG